LRAAALISALIAALPSVGTAGPPSLALPIDCALGQSCFIQQYVDRDPGPGARDFTCGSLSYDGHRGTDFAVPTVRAAMDGVAVLAPANGRVVAFRDGEADHFDDPDDVGAPGRDCGNGVVIDHGDGWETQLCHLRRGSIAVQVDQEVATGDVLGLVGMSGRAAFPHVHLSLRQDGEVVDPFAPGDPDGCGTPGATLWATPVAYVAGGLVDAGFSDAVPDFGAIKRGGARAEALAGDAPALVFWAHLFGTQAGDELRLLIEGPGGVFLDQTVSLERTQARAFRASGRKLGPATRLSGTYHGTAILLRGGVEISRRSAVVDLAR
jgi:hypothetical protein